MADVNIKITLQKDRAQAQLDSLQKSTRRSQKSFDQLAVSVKNSTSAFKVFAGNVAASAFTSLTRSVAEFGASTVKVTGEIETIAAQFEVLTGSAGSANKAIQDLQRFAAQTPFSFKDLAKAEQRLLSFGFSLDRSQELLGELGDVAAASGGDIKELALIFGQVQAAGKLTGERLLQFQERAIPIGPALAKSLGVAESSIKDLVSNGQISFAEFEKAFETLNDTGEFAFEGMIKRSRTLDGRLETLSDSFEQLQASVGSQLAPALKAATTSLTVFIDKIQQSQGFKEFLTFIGDNIPTAIQFAVNSFSFIVNSIFNVIKGFNLFRSGVASAVSAVVFSLTELVKGFQIAVNALGLGDTALGKSLNSVTEFGEGVTQALDSTASGFAKAAADISESQAAVNQAIGEGGKFIIKTYEEELKAAEEQASATVAAETNKTAALKTLTDEQIAVINAKAEAEKKVLNEIESAKQQVALAEEARRIFDSEQDQIFTDERLVRLEDAFTREEEARIQAGINAAETESQKQLLILQAQAAGEKAQLDSLRKKQEAEKALREKNKRIALQGTANLFGALADATSLGGKKLFKLTQAFTLAETVVNSVLAVQRAAASAPFPFNVPAIAAESVRGAVNIAKIKSTAPSFREGGVVPGSSVNGDQVLARVNSGEAILNDRQQAKMFDILNSQGGGQQAPMTTVVEIDGQEVARAVSTQVANGLELGEVF